MGALRFTQEQITAITAKEKTLLVSAAAGSGKTAVLVERIVRLLTDRDHPTRLRRMLIMTFTRAAAGEMRERLARRIQAMAEDDPETAGMAMEDLDGAMICTIHSYCQHLLEREFQAAGIDARLRVCREQDALPLMDRAFREALNAVLEEPTPETDKLVKNFRQGELREMVGSYHDFLMNLPDPQDWMERAVSQLRVENLRDMPWTGVLRQKHMEQLEGLRETLAAMEGMFADPDAVEALTATLESDREVFENLLDAVRANPDGMAEAIRNVKYARAASGKNLTEEQKAWKERFAALRKAFKDGLEEIRGEADLNEARELRDLRTVSDFIAGLNRLTWLTHGHFAAEKNRRGLIDFQDMEQMALGILRDDDLRQTAQEEFDHIFVDECQDVSAVQDAIIQQLHGENNCLFMVGDVKQSIYRFRHADPTRFLQRSRAFGREAGSPERAIFLQKNFRSTPRVLQAVNEVFSRAMRERVTELDYLPEDALVPGLEVTPENNHPVEICLIRNPEKANRAERLRAEAGALARRMKEMKGRLLVDSKGRRVPCSWRHMAVLMATVSTSGEALAELLQSEGIPVYFDGRTAFFETREIREVKSLLEIIDNPTQDMQLLCVLKMPLFAFTDEELAQIRNRSRGKKTFQQAFLAACEGEDRLAAKCAAARDRIDEWRFRAEYMPVIDLMWMLIRDTGYYAYCGAEPGGELRQANLRLMCKKADDYMQDGGVTLSGLIQSLNQEMTSGDATSAKVLGENEDLVRIMTMHKSKGLEFPVVFLTRLGEGIEGGRHAELLQTHRTLGACLPWIDRELGVKRKTFGTAALRWAKARDERAERCRLLYVAMTRAREKLVMIASEEECDKTAWTMEPGDARVAATGCMMDWVMQAVCDQAPMCAEHDGAAGDFSVIHEEAAPIAVADAAVELSVIQRWLNEEALTRNADALWQPWWYDKPAQRAPRPLKTSVTSLVKREVLGDLFATDEEEDEESKRKPEEAELPLRLSPLQERPAFMEEKKQQTAAERGTLTHRFLSLVSLERLRDAAEGEIPAILREESGDMVARGLFTEEEMRLVQTGKAGAFFRTEPGRRMLRAESVRREWSFTLVADRKKNTLLQGIIDCAFEENGAWILCDYKTDHIVSEDAFVQRHRDQLRWYAYALEALTGKKVREQWLYAIEKEKAILVAVDNPVEKGSGLSTSCD